MGRLVLAVLLCGAPALADDRDWAAQVRVVWHEIRAVPLDDAVSTREMQGPWLKPGERERGAYKIEHADGRVTYADKPPTSENGVRAVHKRVRAKDQWYEVSSKGTRFYTYQWRRVHWHAEQRTWKTGGAPRNRAKRDDDLYRAWTKQLSRAPQLRRASWYGAHRSLVRDASGLHTAEQRLEKLQTGRTRPAQGSPERAIERAKEHVQRHRERFDARWSELKEALEEAGDEMDVGDALWRCEEATLRLDEAKRTQREAEGTHAFHRSMAKRKPEHTSAASKALRELESAGRRVQSIRRQRRHAMARVMRALE